jgi:Ca2+-binding RTX toxin-like protein
VTAYLNSLNQLVLSHATDDIEVTNTNSGQALFGLAVGTYTGDDADDGDTAGTEADDVRGDVENLTGGAGDDLLVGHSNSNTLKGGAGDDILSGGYGNSTCANDVDVMEGEADDDTFKMGPAAECGDDVKGGAGVDLVDYQFRSAALTLTLNNTTGDGAASEGDNVRNDVEEVVGGNAADTITGGTGNETLRGGPGDDTISGGAGTDTLVGNSGDDTMNGDAGDDTFVCSGDDTSFEAVLAWQDDMGDGDDIMNGGAGTDKVTYTDRVDDLDVSMCTDALILTGDATSTDAECVDDDGGPAIARLQGTVSIPNGVANGSMAINIGAGAQTVTFASETTAALVAAQINSDVTGTSLIATVDDQNRILLTLTGADMTAQTITVTTSGTADAVGFLSGNLTVTATREGDKLVNLEWVVGGDGDDTLAGDTAAESIEGGAGDDNITGGAGDDTLYGDAGDDILSGGDGDDLISGGADDDNISGGNGDGDVCTVLAEDTETDLDTASCEVN